MEPYGPVQACNGIALPLPNRNELPPESVETDTTRHFRMDTTSITRL